MTKRKAEGPLDTDKKQKKGTIPIHRHAFKGKYLQKHASLLRKADPSFGLLVSCGVQAETRAIGQLSTFLTSYITQLFPDHSSTWKDIPKDLELDVDLKVLGETQEETKVEKQDKKFQMVDTGCAGLVFARFRVNVRPTDFILSVFGNQALFV